MQSVLKFPLQDLPYQQVRMPQHSVILEVTIHRGTICLWALCFPTPYTDTRIIEIVATGGSVEFCQREHISTVQSFHGEVWHIFEIKGPLSAALKEHIAAQTDEDDHGYSALTEAAKEAFKPKARTLNQPGRYDRD